VEIDTASEVASKQRVARAESTAVHRYRGVLRFTSAFVTEGFSCGESLFNKGTDSFITRAQHSGTQTLFVLFQVDLINTNSNKIGIKFSCENPYSLISLYMP
jgi:hypothetical protein